MIAPDRRSRAGRVRRSDYSDERDPDGPGGRSGPTLWDLVESWATDHPGDRAFTDERCSVAIGELHDRALSMAAGLESVGVGPGVRVMLQLPNSVEAAVAICAVNRLGGIVVPVQMALRHQDLRTLIERTDPTVVIGVAKHHNFEHGRMLRELTSDCSDRTMTYLFDGPEVTPPVRSDAARMLGPADRRPDDPAFIIFTAGTSGRPKGCVHSTTTLMFCADGVADALGITSSDCMFMPSPVMHTTGLVNGIVIPLRCRIPAVLQGAWNPDTALEMITRHSCTVTLGATAFAVGLLDAYDPERHDLGRFRLVALGGAPIPGSVVHEAQKRLGCRVASLYGSTEGLILTATRPNDVADRVASSDGRAVDGVRVEITDEAGEPLGVGEVGEVRVRTPGRFLRYWDDPKLMSEAIDDGGRLRTGDLGKVDAEGYLRLTGRIADLVIRGGSNISVVEIEEILIAHESIAEVAIVGKPDRRLGERCCAFIVPAGAPPSVADLAHFLGERAVARFKFPEHVVIVDEIPKNAAGKVLKALLRERAAALGQTDSGDVGTQPPEAESSTLTEQMPVEVESDGTRPEMYSASRETQ